jgi:hypothetical protein
MLLSWLSLSSMIHSRAAYFATAFTPSYCLRAKIVICHIQIFGLRSVDLHFMLDLAE